MQFPGATTQWNSVPGSESGSVGDIYAVEALSTAGDIAGAINEMRGEADGLANSALSIIAECAAFTVTPENITYTPPTFQIGIFKAAEIDDFDNAPTRPNANSLGDEVEFKGQDGLVPFVPESGTHIPGLTAGSPPEPATLGSLGSVPSELTLDDISVDDPPDVSININMPTVPDAPDTNVELPSDLPMIEAEDFVIDHIIDAIDSTDIDTMMERLQSLEDIEVIFPDMDRVFSSMITIANAMYNANVVYAQALGENSSARQSANDSKYDGSLRSIWSSRGQTPFKDVSAYAQRESTRASTIRNNNVSVFKALSNNSMIQHGYRFGAAYHKPEIDVVIAENSFNIDTMVTSAEIQIELAQGVAAAARGAMAVLELQAAQATAEYANASAEASQYEIRMDIASNKGALNRAKSMIFAAREEAKATTVTLAEAKKIADDGRLKAFAGKIRGLTIKAETLGFDIEKYKAQASAFGANLVTIKSTYDEYRARSGLVKAQNASVNAQIASSEAEIRSAGAKSNATAVEKGAEATRKGFESQKRTTALHELSLDNARESALGSIESAWYRLKAGMEKAKYLEDRAELAGITEENQSAAKFFVSAAEAAARAAELTQNSNIQLSEAYATAQEAAGRASAAIESGRLSGWNATASLSATGSLDQSETGSLSVSEDFSTSTTESYAQSTNLSA